MISRLILVKVTFPYCTLIEIITVKRVVVHQTAAFLLLQKIFHNCNTLKQRKQVAESLVLINFKSEGIEKWSEMPVLLTIERLTLFTPAPKNCFANNSITFPNGPKPLIFISPCWLKVVLEEISFKLISLIFNTRKIASSQGKNWRRY